MKKTEQPDKYAEMETVKTTTPDWQKVCLELTEAKKDFVVESCSEVDLQVIEKLCRSTKYRKFVINKGLLLMPGF